MYYESDAYRPETADQLLHGDHDVMDRGTSFPVSNQLKLPTIPPPEFSDPKTQSLELFLSSFENILEKSRLNQFEKFLYLERQLTNGPLLLIKSLNSTQQSYDAAKELLKKAFASPTNVKFDLIERLTKLKLSYPGEPYHLISELRIISDSAKDLQLEADDFIQYFFWNGINEVFQNVLINICNETKPSIASIHENIFKATERYLSSMKDEKFGAIKNSRMRVSKPSLDNRDINVSDKEESLKSMAVNLKANSKSENNSKTFNTGGLCSSDGSINDHFLSKCPKYTDCEAKVKKLISVGGCTKCGNVGHPSNTCRFRFRRSCRFCKRYHYDFLCQKPVNINKTNAICNGTISVNSSTFNFEASKKVILPTFTCKLGSKNKFRALRDSGAQYSLILSSISRANKLKIIKKKCECL